MTRSGGRAASLILLLLVGLLLSGAPAPRMSSFTDRDIPVLSHAQTGDLILRRGRSWISRTVLWADPAGSYSHVGIAIRRGDQTWIVHAEPGENLGGGFVKAETIDSFLAPDRATAWAQYRPHHGLDQMEIALLDSLAFEHVKKRTPFDLDFDLDDSTRVYCTELIAELYRTLGRELDLDPRPLRFLTTEYQILMPGDLIASPAFYELKNSHEIANHPVLVINDE